MNFSDPPTSEKKIFFAEPDEHTPVKFSKKSIFSNQNEKISVNSVPFENGESKDIVIKKTQNIKLELEAYLNKNASCIFPDLVNSTVDISSIIHEISPSNLEVVMLLNLFSNNNVKTVGDLASLSELDIIKYPLKLPKIENIKSVLHAFKFQSQHSYTSKTQVDCYTPNLSEESDLQSIICNLASLPKEKIKTILTTVFNLQSENVRAEILDVLLH